MDNRKTSRIQFRQSFDGYNKESWPEMIEWLEVNLSRLEAALREPLLKVNKKLKQLPKVSD